MNLFLKTLKIILLLLIIVINFNLSNAYNTEYNSKITIGGDISEKNISSNIKKAGLLKLYVDKFVTEINSYKLDYEINNETINKNLFNLKLMSNALKKIQTTNIEKKIAEDVTNSVISGIKGLKTEVKNQLKIEISKNREILVNKQVALGKKGEYISKKLTNFIKNFTPKVRLLKNESKRKNILINLVNINKESSKLGTISSKNFKNTRELEKHYSTSSLKIKEAIIAIKNTIIGK